MDINKKLAKVNNKTATCLEISGKETTAARRHRVKDTMDSAAWLLQAAQQPCPNTKSLRSLRRRTGLDRNTPGRRLRDAEHVRHLLSDFMERRGRTQQIIVTHDTRLVT